MHWPGIEPGSTAWEAAILTTIPPTLKRIKSNDTRQNKFTEVSDEQKNHECPSHNEILDYRLQLKLLCINGQVQ